MEASLAALPAEFSGPLAAAMARVQEATAHVASRAAQDPEEVGAAATPYLRLVALTLLAWFHGRAAAIAQTRGDDRFYRAKLATARFFVAQLLPQTAALHAMITAGSGTVMALTEDAF
jgi:butyryl-CoA dehydrogenase